MGHLGNDGFTAAGSLIVAGNSTSEEAVDCRLVMIFFYNCFKVTAMSFLSLKRGDTAGDYKTSTSFVAAK